MYAWVGERGQGKNEHTGVYSGQLDSVLSFGEARGQFHRVTPHWGRSFHIRSREEQTFSVRDWKANVLVYGLASFMTTRHKL